jgi:hypothetical protein
MASSVPGSGSMLVASAHEPPITVRPVTLRSPVADGNFSCEIRFPPRRDYPRATGISASLYAPQLTHGVRCGRDIVRMFGKGRYDI